MKTSKPMKTRNIILVLVLFMIPVISGAQSLKGSYFLDNSLNRHELNPAFAPRANYFQLFCIGNLGVGVGSNIDVPSLLYPTADGKLATFLHPDVSVKQFERAFPKNPHMDVDLRTTLMGFGFYTKQKSYWTFDVDLRTNIDMDLPGDFFRFLKRGTGVDGGSYNVGNFNAYAMAGIQASLGYSRDIFKGFRAGIKGRVIAPVAYAGLNLENVRLTASEEKWTVKTEGYANIALAGLTTTEPSQDAMLPSFGFDLNRLLADKVLAGFGWSFDLGVEYTLELGTIVDGLSVSAAVTDLGCIHYKKETLNSFKTGTENDIEWKGLEGVMVDNIDAVGTMLEDFVEDAKNSVVNLSKIDSNKGLTRSTMPSFHVGVEMPFLKRKMSVGLLYSSRISHSYARNELTLSYNLTPCKWFALGLNYSFLNTARTMGFVLELTPRVGPAFFLGMDYLPVSFAPAEFVPMLKMLPMGLRANLNFGIAFHTGGKTTKNPKKVKNRK